MSDVHIISGKFLIELTFDVADLLPAISCGYE
jgi:hypothetical protein